MTEYYHGKVQEARKLSRSPKILRLFLKQSIAALVCGGVAFFMHATPIPRLNNYADALGRALRYEMNLPTEKLTDWVKERIQEH